MSEPVDLLAGFQAELQAERASTLGDAGRKVEKTLAALVAEPTDEHVDEAATAVWHYMIVREGAGMHDHREAFAIYGVPPRVLARVGILRKPA